MNGPGRNPRDERRERAQRGEGEEKEEVLKSEGEEEGRNYKHRWNEGMGGRNRREG